MRYRKLDANGDHVFGQSGQDFYTDIDAVRQAIQTNLALIRGTWWRDINAGFDLYSILGNVASATNLAAADNKIQSVILGTEGVTGIVDFSSSFDPLSRAYSYTATVQTQYSTTVIEGTL